MLSLFDLLKDKHIAFICMTSVIVNGFVGICEPLIPLYLSNEFDESVLYQGVLFLFATGSYLLFTPIAGKNVGVYTIYTQYSYYIHTIPLPQAQSVTIPTCPSGSL